MLFFSNKQSDNFNNYVEKSPNPNCNNLTPCILDENNELIKWDNNSYKIKCGNNKFLYPLDIAKVELGRPFKSGMPSVRAYLENYTFKGNKNINKKVDDYVKNLEKKSCRKKDDKFCKLRFGDRYEINPNSGKKYFKVCGSDEKNLWKYNNDDLGDEILSDNNGGPGSFCNAPKGKSCG